ncbi:MAG: hypothetical protein HQL11_02700 [Candidatus Omnitrophica bacterium]|nr:hypothetical protein [Candidatus Omnitrophota bacterium]
MNQKKKKNPITAVLLSLIPGAAQIYLGRTKKAVGFLCIFAGICAVWIFSPWVLGKFIAFFLYLSIALVPMIEHYQIARSGVSALSTDARWYVVFLLLTNGFAALPLLWQSERFGRASKFAWSILVPLFAAVYLFVLVRYWNDLERLIRRY